MEVSGQLHAPVALPPGKELLVSIGWEVRLANEGKKSDVLMMNCFYKKEYCTVLSN